jgi:hypothetical protein
MRLWKIAIPLTLAVGCITVDALAQKVNHVYLQNRDVNPITVDARAGVMNPGADGAGCANLKASAVITIAPKSTENISVTNERFLCLKLAGAPVWKVVTLPAGQDYSFYVN